MAILYPSLEIIQKLKVPPTPGERKLLDSLIKELDDNYEVFYQPFVNGDNPDFIILKRGGGVIIVEVKDWDLQNYEIDPKFNWHLKKNWSKIKSPFEQVHHYKENLYHLHIEGLYENLKKKSKHWAIVNCAVYFHGTTKQQFSAFIEQNLSNELLGKYRNEIEHYGKIFQDNVAQISLLPKKFNLHEKSWYFTEELYKHFLRTIKHPFHYLEQGKEIPYSKEQLALANSPELQRKKIKGVAGCGKTLVLAKRAVEAHKLVGGQVLILTYNLALVNYIHDRISDVREIFSWENFYITNYHQFFITQANNHNLKIEDLSCFDNEKFFESVANSTRRFKAIFIDEIQDYSQSWIDLVIEYFSFKNQSEIMVFGDEKQNIYGRPLDTNKEIVVRQVPGKWNQSLNAAYRFTEEIANLVFDFQEAFFSQKYKLDIFQKLATPEFAFNRKQIFYMDLGSTVAGLIVETIYSYLRKNMIHSSDCTILGPRVDHLREIEQTIRLKIKERTTITFETYEEYIVLKTSTEKKAREVLKLDNKTDLTAIEKEKFKKMAKMFLENELEILRRNRKVNFHMGSGKIKISTIHSFKGWESHTVILLIDDDPLGGHETMELFYSGITRARNNIIIINLGNLKINNFFQKQIEKQQVQKLEVVQ